MQVHRNSKTQEPSQPTEQTEGTVTPNTETEVVEEGEEVFDFQLTDQEVDGAEEDGEVFDFQLTEEELE